MEHLANPNKSLVFCCFCGWGSVSTSALMVVTKEIIDYDSHRHKSFPSVRRKLCLLWLRCSSLISHTRLTFPLCVASPQIILLSLGLPLLLGWLTTSYVSIIRKHIAGQVVLPSYQTLLTPWCNCHGCSSIFFCIEKNNNKQDSESSVE